MKYVYIHGFNSGPESNSAAKLEKLLDLPVFRVRNDYSKTYEECMRKTTEQIADAYGRDERLVILGTSLGGFYASQLRMAGIVKIIAWNPVIYPALQLAQFIGENTRFTDNVKWNFSEESLLSYAQAPDPRQWHNFAWPSYLRSDFATPERYVILGRQDELLNPLLAQKFWQEHAFVKFIDSGHHFENFDHAMKFLTL